MWSAISPQELVSRARALKQRASRWRFPITLFAGSAFIFGVFISYRSLSISVEDINIFSLSLIFFIYSPIRLILSAFNLQVTAKVLERRISLISGVSVSAFATVAEILPIPGGAIVRGGALMNAGAKARESAWIVTATAILTLSMAAALGALSLAVSGYEVGYAAVVAGTAVTVLSLRSIWRRGGWRVAVELVLLRLIQLVLSMVRMVAAFSAVGAPIDFRNAALFVVSAALGTSAAIVPSGLGVSEAIGAALATLVNISPAAAFLALAVNRIIGLVSSALIALLLVSKRTDKAVHE